MSAEISGQDTYIDNEARRVRDMPKDMPKPNGGMPEYEGDMPGARRASVWSRTADIPEREPLKGDLRADVAVIGAGMAGVLTAYRLSQSGAKVVVIEGKRIGSGQTKNTTAKITSQHGMAYDALIRKFGQGRVAEYAAANELAIREYETIVESLHIDCDFRTLPSFLYSRIDDEPLWREEEAAKKLGLPAEFSQDTDLPFPIAGALRFDGQAQFHPLRFLRTISEGLEIYENTPVFLVDGKRVRTDRGTVTADSVVFATHFPFINVPGWYFLRMHQERSYVLAMESDWLPDGLYYSADADGLSFREAEGLLLMGGGNHRTGENSGGGRYDDLRRRAREMLTGFRETASWSAQDCMTLDGVPYIGAYSPCAPGWYVATGFGKWGMSSSMVAAMLIAGLITGNAPDWAEAFAPSRFRLSAAAKSLATEAGQAVKGLSRAALAIPRQTLDALPIGHGGIVEADGGKAGVYKDETGQCHIVNARCPHLGCQLEWNPDELSWDCPCHGSRFRYDGSVIDNPAQTKRA